MLDELIKTETDADGRTRYTVAGVLATYNADEANDLTSTGIFRIACPLTRAAAQTTHQALAPIAATAGAHGLLEKFPWE